jgi:DNA invertase Pin-like site-specific DNA recombinase
MKHLGTGDTLVVWRLDRLGQSLKHLIETITALQKRNIGFKSLTEQKELPRVSSCTLL